MLESGFWGFVTIQSPEKKAIQNTLQKSLFTSFM